MSNYFGDIAEDATIRIPFNTFDSNDPAASVTVTDLADADIKVHKDGATSPLTTDGATVSLNHNGITGCHYAIIDTSAHTDYATGSDYDVRVEGITVDAGTLNPWIGSFSIQNRYSAAGAADATEAKQDIIIAAVKTNAAGTDIAADIIAMKAETALIVADTNELQTDDVPGLIATLDAVVDTVKAETALIVADTNELQTDDVPGLIATLDAVVDTVKAETVLILEDTGTTIPATIATIDNEIAVIDGIVDTILIDTADLQANQGNWLTATGFATEAKQDVIDGIVDSILVDTGTTIPGTITTIDNEIAVIDGIVDSILVDTAEIGVAGVGLTNLAGISNISSLVVSAGGAVDALTQGFLNTVVTETTAGRISNNMSVFYDNADAASAQTQDDVGGGGGGGGDATEAKQDIITADTNELQGDWTNGGRLDTILDTINTNAASIAGPGADACTIEVLVGGSPLADADVWITNDSPGNNMVAGTLQTDSNGEAVFLLDDTNVYYLWAQKDGFNAIQGQQFTASAD